MNKPAREAREGERGGDLLTTLERLLAIDATDVRGALDEAAQLVSEALAADKVDVLLYEPQTDMLVAVGVSNTPMGHRERAIGMDRLPVAQGGRTVAVFQTGQTFLTGHADRDPQILRGFTEGLGIRSMVTVPLIVAGTCSGVLSATSAQRDAFSPETAAFLQAVAQWVGMVAHRAELAEQAAQRATERAAREAAERAAHAATRMQRLTAHLAGALTSEQVGDAIIAESVAALGANAGVIAVLSDDGTVLRAIRVVGYPEEVAARWREWPTTAPVALADAVRLKEPIIMESGDERLARYPLGTTVAYRGEEGAAVALPLLVGERPIGSIGLSFPGPCHFDTQEHAFMRTVADLCAQALERARLYDVEQHSRKEAEAAIHMRDNILSIATHDLRSPLTNLLGRAQLVQRRLSRGTVVEPAWLNAQMQGIVDGVAHMLAIITEMSDVARLQLGQELDLHQEEVNVPALVRRVVEEYRIGPGAPVLTLDAPTDALMAQADPHRLMRVLRNLIGNAIKYSPQGTPISVGVRDDDQGAWITVADNGVGIPKEELPRVFTRFYRASTAAHIAGTGIGLAGSKAIVEQHGGRIMIDSTIGIGTTVTVWLPRHKPHAGPPT